MLMLTFIAKVKIAMRHPYGGGSIHNTYTYTRMFPPHFLNVSRTRNLCVHVCTCMYV